MAERITKQERPITPEKSREETYVDALKLKRDVLSSHQTMGLIRKEVNKRINEMSEDEFKTDSQVLEYEKIGAEYDRQRKLLEGLLQKLPEEDREKLAGLTNLKQVEAELASPDKEKAPAETPEGMSEAEIDKMIQYTKDTIRTLTGELFYWEAKKVQLNKKQEAESTETITPESGESSEHLKTESIATEQPVAEKLENTLTLKDVDDYISRLEKSSPPPLLMIEAWKYKRAELRERQKAETGVKKREDTDNRIKELGNLLTEKYRILHQEVSVIDRRPLEEEIKKLEDERNQLTKELKPSGKITQPEHKITEKPVKVAPEEPIQEILTPPTPKPVQEKPVLKEEEAVQVQERRETPTEVAELEQAETEDLLAASEQEEGAITVEQKDEVDRIIAEHPDNPAEFIPDGIVKKENIEKAEELNIDNAVNEAVAVLEDKKAAPQEKTILAKIRESVKTKAAIYVGTGLLTLMSFKGEAREYLTEMPGNVVKVLDKAPDIKASLDLPKMIASEAARYNVKPYLVARFIGSNDYFGLEAIKMADTLGLEGTARSMYESSLAGYMENFAETRKANRFTTLDKHTARGHIDAFVQIYTGQEQADSGIETYGKLKEFLQDKFGAAKAYELALKVSSEKDINPVLLEASKKDAKEQSAIMSQAMAKSNIYFNQEEGIFNVVYKDKLIDTYTSRAGFMNVPESGYVRGTLGYGRTPDGQFAISSIERGYSTLRWKDAFLPYGAEIRLGETGEVEYKYRNRWYPATGPEATYFDQGKKVQPNKLEKDMNLLAERSKGETPLTKSDFYVMGGLMSSWEKNPFGPISYRLAGRPELIHSNPNDADNILHPSHGCIRLDKEDVRVLEPYIGAGISKIRISSKASGSWRAVS